MNLQKSVLTLAAVLNALYGISGLLAPASVANSFGVEADPVLDLVIRGMGAFCIAFALLAWGAREAPPSRLLSSVLLALLAGYVLATVVNITALLTDVVTVNALGLTAMLVDLGITAGLAALYLQGRKVPVATGAI